MGFDWTTFAFQLVNVLVLLAILWHFLFRPVAGIIEARQAAVARTLAEAEAAKAAAAAAAERGQGGGREDGGGPPRPARHGAPARQRRSAPPFWSRPATRRPRSLPRPVRPAEAVRDEARAEMLARARDLSLAIAERLMQSLPEDRPRHRLCRTAGRGAGRAARAGSASAALRRRGSAPGRPPAPQRGGAGRRRARPWRPHLAAEPRIEVDPGLIAGLELRGRHGVVENSLRHDLTRIAEAMADER